MQGQGPKPSKAEPAVAPPSIDPSPVIAANMHDGSGPTGSMRPVAQTGVHVPPQQPEQQNEAKYRAQTAHLQYLIQYQQQLLMQAGQTRAYGGHPYGYGMPLAGAAGVRIMPQAQVISPQQSASMMIHNMQMAGGMVVPRPVSSGRNPLSVPDYAHIQVRSPLKARV